MKQNYIIPLFIPHYGCPHVCIFCNQKKITGQVSPITPQDVRTRLAAELALISPKRLIEVAFYGGSFTALPLSQQNELLAPATELLQLGKIHSIRLSTRPDCISRPILENLRNMGVSIIELGVQSLDDEVLLASERGHKAYHVFAAVEMLKEYGFSFGIQLMPGLPKEDSVSLLRSAALTASLRPDMVRLYPVIVLADTPLAKVYQQGLYKPLSLEKAIAKTAMVKQLLLEHHIPVIRMGLQATEELDNSSVRLAGPYHPAFGEMVISYLYRQEVSRILEELNFSDKANNQKLELHCCRRDESKLRGQKNNNLRYWQELFSCQIFIKANLSDDAGIYITYNGISFGIKKII